MLGVISRAHAQHHQFLQVSYYYDSDVGDYYYGMSHPMKPHRVRMAHDLIVRYGLYKQLQVRCVGRQCVPLLATFSINQPSC